MGQRRAERALGWYRPSVDVPQERGLRSVYAAYFLQFSSVQEGAYLGPPRELPAEPDLARQCAYHVWLYSHAHGTPRRHVVSSSCRVV